ncbi:hypothetical protein NMG60_11034533 [Bertholletia excelsa]
MGSTKREQGVLKLVYPGRYVEYYTEPITAGEVMERNPRYCVARPDVFQYPWIVVRPESVLLPGGVFFMVPKHTIHRLLKARGFYDEQPSQQEEPTQRLDRDYGPKRASSPRTARIGNTLKQNEPPKRHNQDHGPKRTASPSKACAGNGPKQSERPKRHDQSLATKHTSSPREESARSILKQNKYSMRHEQDLATKYTSSPSMARAGNTPKQDKAPKRHDEHLATKNNSSTSKAWARNTPEQNEAHDQDLGCKHTPSPSKAWAGTTPKHQKNFSKQTQAWYDEEDMDRILIQQSFYKARPSVIAETTNNYEGLEFQYINCFKAGNGPVYSKEYNGNRTNGNHSTENNCHTKAIILKSCIRKHDSVRKHCRFRVTFAFPVAIATEDSPDIQDNLHYYP